MSQDPRDELVVPPPPSGTIGGDRCKIGALKTFYDFALSFLLVLCYLLLQGDVHPHLLETVLRLGRAHLSRDLADELLDPLWDLRKGPLVDEIKRMVQAVLDLDPGKLSLHVSCHCVALAAVDFLSVSL